MLSCQFLTEAILEIAGFLGGEGSVDEDGESELVTAGGGDIASEGDNAFECTSLGTDVAVGRACLHTLVEGSVHASNGECGVEGLIDGRSVVGIAEHGHLCVGGDVVVE